MCRPIRIKDEDFIYHVMMRSISDIPLFRNDKDRDRYLFYVKKYQRKFDFKVYVYCLMTTHAHLLIDANGADISKFMHGINQSYAQYFNKKYNRHGHVFQDRFKSKVVQDEGYLFTVSAYIHNNPTGIEGYEKCPEDYKYSTLRIYLGLEDDEDSLVDEEFIMGFFNKNVKKAREKYYKFVMKCDDEYMKLHHEFKDEKGEYRSERKSGLVCFLIRYYCYFTFKGIYSIIGEITLSRVSEISNIGLELIENNTLYKNIKEDFLKENGRVEAAKG